MNFIADGNGPLYEPLITDTPTLISTTSVSIVPTPMPEKTAFQSWGIWGLLILVVIIIGGYFVAKRIIKRVK